MLIAEVGQNFCGDMALARLLIREAKDNGANLVKFQLYDHNEIYGNNPNIPNVELSYDQAKMLFDYGQQEGIEVFFSVFDVERVKWCESIGVSRYKLATGAKSDILIKAVWETRKPIIASFKMFGEHWYYQSLGFLVDKLFGNHIDFDKPFTRCKILYCVPLYPTPLDKLRFGEIYFTEHNPYYEPRAYTPVNGFSDHTIGLWAAKVALARGAKIIEKHFCINHQTGIDAEWSMTPSELAELKEFEGKVKEIL